MPSVEKPTILRVVVVRKSADRFDVIGITDMDTRVWLGSASTADLANGMAADAAKLHGVSYEPWDDVTYKILIATRDWCDAWYDGAREPVPVCAKHRTATGCPSCPIVTPVCPLPAVEALLNMPDDQYVMVEKMWATGIVRALEGVVSDRRKRMVTW